MEITAPRFSDVYTEIFSIEKLAPSVHNTTRLVFNSDAGVKAINLLCLNANPESYIGVITYKRTFQDQEKDFSVFVAHRDEKEVPELFWENEDDSLYVGEIFRQALSSRLECIRELKQKRSKPKNTYLSINETKFKCVILINEVKNVFIHADGFRVSVEMLPVEKVIRLETKEKATDLYNKIKYLMGECNDNSVINWRY